MSFVDGSGSSSTAAAAIGFPGGVPSFPSTDALETSSFKVVVGSWRRINPATSNASDFTVDVASYAPKTPFVTRVQLVDVDIPNTQQLIEAAWSRLYFQQGVATSLACRSLEVVVDGGAGVLLVLPLPLDVVTLVEPLADGVTRIFTEHCAPWPINAVSETWRRLPGGQGLRVFGLAAFPAGFLLKGDNVRGADVGTMAFDVISYSFAEAVAEAESAPGPPPLLCLCAATIPGPSFMAGILTKVLPTALALASPAHCREDTALSAWQMQFQYSTSEDRFSLYTRFPRGVKRASMGGPLAEYMGFGAFFDLDVLEHEVRSPLCAAPNTRFHPKDAYGKLDSDSPRKEIEIAKNLQRAFNTYNWEPFTFNIRFPGSPASSVAVPGGRMTLRQLAATLTEVLMPYAVQATVIFSEDGGKSGIRFEHADRVFALDFSVDASFNPSTIGYSRVVFPAARIHFPTRVAVHIPLPFPDCLPPACDITVLYNEDTQHISLHSVPFKEFPATMKPVTAPLAYCNVFTIDTTTVGSFRHGLQVSARLVLDVVNLGVHTQYAAFVLAVHVNSLTAFDVLLPSVDLTTTWPVPFPLPFAVTVVPQDRLPINLYLQPNSTREKLVFPQMIGFQPLTYEGTYDLASPGSLDMRQDPYLLLCLSFQAEDASAQCGNVYYPFENYSQLIFAKIMRSTCTYKADYDRAFFYDFKGAGIHLGYIRVRVLNSDGTLYESHGHPSSVCLRFDVKQSGVSMGGPGAVLMATADSQESSRAPLTLFHGRGGAR